MNLPDYQPTAAPVPAERRRYPRYHTHVPIEIHEEGSDVPVRTETTDLSRGGCYIELTFTLAIGGYVNATLSISGTTVRVRGRVVTRHPQFGNGIMFLEFQEGGERILASHLDSIKE